jgi:hypothetical protein
MSQCHIDDGPKILVVSLTADVTRVDPVLRQRLRASRILREKQVPIVVKVADDGDGESEPIECPTIPGTAAADASLLTVTRTSSLPARARSATCRVVDWTSAVSVLVIDWTTIG